MQAYQPHSRGRCPHCHTIVKFESAPGQLGPSSTTVFSGHVTSEKERLNLTGATCPHCLGLIVTMHHAAKLNDAWSTTSDDEYLAWPRQGMRLVPPEVPENISSEYNEAALVLQLSPKASAALSRRCLQAVLREQGYPQRDLAQQIDAVLPRLPGYIAPNVDAIRNIGNFAAHPTKSQASGEIVDVEPGEAEWNLDVLDELFDFFYVQPELAKQKRDALNAKLTAAGKPPLK